MAKQQRNPNGQFKNMGKGDRAVSGLPTRKSVEQWSERARTESRVYYKADGTQAKVRATGQRSR